MREQRPDRVEDDVHDALTRLDAILKQDCTSKLRKARETLLKILDQMDAIKQVYTHTRDRHRLKSLTYNRVPEN